MTSGRFASSQSRSGPEKWSDALTSGWRYKAATSGAYARSVTSEKTDGKFPAGWCWWKTSANRRRSATNDAFYQKWRLRTLCVQTGRLHVNELDKRTLCKSGLERMFGRLVMYAALLTALGIRVVSACTPQREAAPSLTPYVTSATAWRAATSQ